MGQGWGWVGARRRLARPCARLAHDANAAAAAAAGDLGAEEAAALARLRLSRTSRSVRSEPRPTREYDAWLWYMSSPRIRVRLGLGQLG